MPQPVLHAIVHGRVQGVFFRAHTQREARDMGISGWVRNLPDGTVEVEATGEAETLQRLLRWLEHGPPSARVEEVQADWGTTDRSPSGFTILE